jgi:hypothetical protein
LIGGVIYLKTNESIRISNSNHPFFAVLIKFIDGLSSLSMQDFVEFGKQIQEKFPEVKIPEIINEFSDILLLNAGFRIEKIPGIYLLTGIDLPQLHFTHKTRIKRIL